MKECSKQSGMGNGNKLERGNNSLLPQRAHEILSHSHLSKCHKIVTMVTT